MRSSGRGVGVAGAPEDTEVVISRRGAEKSVVGSGSRGSSGRETVEEIGGGV